jgi:hypothetical protein
MNKKIHQVLKNALEVLTDNHSLNERDGYHALASDMSNVMREIKTVLLDDQVDDDKHDEMVKVAYGLDGKRYLVFGDNCSPGQFIRNLGFNEFSVPYHHFGQYENAIEIDLTYHNQPCVRFSEKPQISPVTEAEQWLRAISTWLLENDYDMTLPDGILDTDPLDIADRLHKICK